MKNPRDVDAPLVHAYLARRALDYFWALIVPCVVAQIAGARSAGRVQSVCLRLIVEREMEIEAFNPQEYWMKAQLSTPRGQSFEARLTSLAGKNWINMIWQTARRRKWLQGNATATYLCNPLNQNPRSATHLPRS